MVSNAHGRYVWQVAPNSRVQSLELAAQLDVHPAIARVLLLRGATTIDTARRFLNPSLDNLSDPFLLTDMRVAVDRIAKAKDRGETVLVFGDYDVDGISGAALLVRALRRFGIANCVYGMPNRLQEGYGLSVDRVDWAYELGVALIITVDNGTAAHAAIDRARERAIDVIVTDHHLIESGLPPALAVINPKREAIDHPAAELCGSGVALKLAHALTGELADVDLAALGTIADVVPLVGENRDIVAEGLRYAAQFPRPGISALADVSKVAIQSLKSEDVAFQLGPRINAGGRMGDGVAGLELLLTDSRDQARELAGELDAANEERKQIESETLAEALATLQSNFLPAQRSIVLASKNWHRGVIGIVASRIQATYYRPVVLIALGEDGVGRGSARSITGFNIAAAIESCKEHLEACGGHTMAAGLTVREDCLKLFQDAFEHAACSLIDGEIQRILNIDAQVGLTEIDTRLVRTLERLQPFGTANPSPVFCSYAVPVARDSVRELRGGHMKLMLKDGNRLFDAIGFRMGNRIDDLRNAEVVDVAFTPQLNTWRGETNVQLVLKDIGCAES